MKKVSDIAAPLVLLLALIALWQFVCVAGYVPSYLLPSPTSICADLVKDNETFLYAAGYTLVEAVAGLAIGVASGFVIAVILDRFELAKKAVMPLLSVSQSIPVIAIAPIIVLFLGFGIMPKIALVAVMTFFPISIACLGGFADTPKETIDMSTSCGASWLRTLLFVKVPSSMQAFFDSLKISVTYAFSGAVIAEWLGGDFGLGVVMTRARKSFDYTSLFSCVVIIVIITILMVAVVKIVEKRTMKWRNVE